MKEDIRAEMTLRNEKRERNRLIVAKKQKRERGYAR